jgi:hypothetical protein
MKSIQVVIPVNAGKNMSQLIVFIDTVHSSLPIPEKIYFSCLKEPKLIFVPRRGGFMKTKYPIRTISNKDMHPAFRSTNGE